MDSPPPPPQGQPPTQLPQQVRIGQVVRDIILVWIFTAIGGFVVGLATAAGGPQHDPQRYILALAASNILLGTLAFTIVGCLAPTPRWRHLAFVALGSWVSSLINVLFFGFSIGQWIFTAFGMAIMMGLGGALSYLFKKDGIPPS